MRTQQLSITFPQKKQVLKEELLRMKQEENLNLSSYMVRLIENDIGFSVSQKFKQTTQNFSWWTPIVLTEPQGEEAGGRAS